MHRNTIFIALILATLPTDFSLAQTISYGNLGESDATWANAHGQPVAVGRDAWRYDTIHVYTRSWYTGPPQRTGANFAGYSAADYSVRYIEFVRVRTSIVKARLILRRMLPVDAKRLGRRVTAAGSVESYRSQWLVGRIRPLLAGEQPCISPWGYGLGIIKARYHQISGGTIRVVADLGESHEVPLKECAWQHSAPNKRLDRSARSEFLNVSPVSSPAPGQP